MIGETVTVLPRVEGVDDRYHKPVYTWPLPGIPVSGVLVAPGEAVEGNETIRDRVDTACTLFFRGPVTVTVGPYDRVIVRGTTWSVDGGPAVWDSGSWAAGMTVKLKASEG